MFSCTEVSLIFLEFRYTISKPALFCILLGQNSISVQKHSLVRHSMRCSLHYLHYKHQPHACLHLYFFFFLLFVLCFSTCFMYLFIFIVEQYVLLKRFINKVESRCPFIWKVVSNFPSYVTLTDYHSINFYLVNNFALLFISVFIFVNYDGKFGLNKR